MLSTREAAEYCGVPAKKFGAVCPVTAVQLPGLEPRFDMRDLDDWLDACKAGSNNGDDDIIGKLGA